MWDGKNGETCKAESCCVHVALYDQLFEQAPVHDVPIPALADESLLDVQHGRGPQVVEGLQMG
jgi:hypothetical protein